MSLRTFDQRRSLCRIIRDLVHQLIASQEEELAEAIRSGDLGLQQFLGEFFGSYRVIEGPRGWLDLLAGFRYTYLGEQVGLQANNMAIDTASTQLVDQFAQQLTTPTSDLRTLIDRNIVDQLTALRGRNPKLPVGPIAAGQ